MPSWSSQPSKKADIHVKNKGIIQGRTATAALAMEEMSRCYRGCRQVSDWGVSRGSQRGKMEAEAQGLKRSQTD